VLPFISRCQFRINPPPLRLRLAVLCLDHAATLRQVGIKQGLNTRLFSRASPARLPFQRFHILLRVIPYFHLMFLQ
jgi:hypothetical protein